MNPVHEQGAKITKEQGSGVQFSLYSASARAVKVAVYDPALARLKGIFSLAKSHYGLWSGYVENAVAGDYYVYHVSHTHAVRVGHYYNDRHGLLDPYARELAYTDGRCGMPELMAVVRDASDLIPESSKPAP